MSGQALHQFNKGYNDALQTQHFADREAARQAGIAAGEDVATQDRRVASVAPPGPHDNFLVGGLCQIITYMAPHKALAKQKRWMRRFCRKPADMTIREFTNYVTTINDDELPILPPFGGNTQKLSDDEIVDILLNGIPRSWTREMDKLDFDPVVSTLSKVIQFCERMEAAEDFEPARNGNKTNNSSKDKSKNKSKGNASNKGNGDKYCLLHGDNNTHTTDECHVLKKQAKQLRGNDGDKKPAFKNKTWKRDADKSTSSSKKELATFVRKQARKELYAFAKKRKANDDDDEKSVASLNNVESKEEGEIDLSVFNYAKMDDLKIESSDSDDDSISV